MKIGIITYWDSNDNYGQILQCYALQKYLINMGHSPYLIRYKEEQISTGFKISKLRTYFFNFSSYFKYFLQKRRNKKYAHENQNDKRDFIGFRNKEIISSEKIYNEIDLMTNPPIADAYICGSDQIWGGSEMYYLPFAPKESIKIAYAPSFGGTNPFNNNPEIITSLLSRFNFLGLREQSGVALLHEHGFNHATQVVDPTLLLNANDYDCLITEESQNTSDAFVYLLGSPIICNVKDIFAFLNSKNLSYTYIASQGRVDSFEKTYSTIPGWINKIKRSKIVITNSFHCIIFSLIYHRPFIYIPLSDSFSRMNDRLTDILSKCDLLGQIYIDSFYSICSNPDFSKFDKFKNEQTERSTYHLDTHLRSN